MDAASLGALGANAGRPDAVEDARAAARAAARRAMGADGRDGAEVAREFEGILLRQVVSALRKTVPEREDGMTGGQILDGLMETTLADHLARAGGIGLSTLLEANIRGDAPLRTPDGILTAVDAAALPPYRGGADALSFEALSPEALDEHAPDEILGAGQPARGLADVIPPGEDAWLDDPDAAARLREVLLRGTWGRPAAEGDAR